MKTCFCPSWVIFAGPVLVALLAGCSAGASGTQADSWGVRLSGHRLESLSNVNVDKPARTGTLATRLVATRTRGESAIEVHADATTAVRLDAEASSQIREIDNAMDWMQRMRPSGQPPGKIILTLIDSRQRTRVRRTHPMTDATIVDLVVAMPDTVSPPSVGIGKALSTALHEMHHAITARGTGAARPSRRDEEYQASLVESCYLVDTLRTGDTLRLVPRERAGTDEYFVTAQSRNAAREAIEALVRASGTATVHWYDYTALLGLKLACGTSIPSLAPTAAPLPALIPGNHRPGLKPQGATILVFDPAAAPAQEGSLLYARDASQWLAGAGRPNK